MSIRKYYLQNLPTEDYKIRYSKKRLSNYPISAITGHWDSLCYLSFSDNLGTEEQRLPELTRTQITKEYLNFHSESLNH